MARLAAAEGWRRAGGRRPGTAPVTPAADLSCYRCGASLAALSPPLSRRDQCPQCSADLHVCRMCLNFRRNVPRQCTEDGAEEVLEKERPNFCDWFRPSPSAFDPAAATAAARAEQALASLFGEGEAADDADPAAGAAEDLFR